MTGKINADTTPVLKDALAQARRDDNAHLVIDLSALTSMDAVGLYALFEAGRPRSTLYRTLRETAGTTA